MIVDMLISCNSYSIKAVYANSSKAVCLCEKFTWIENM
jgi:hypothetical protein